MRMAGASLAVLPDSQSTFPIKFVMLNIALASAATAGATLLMFSIGGTGIVTPTNHSEPGSLVLYGLGLFAIAILARRLPSRSRT